MMLIPMDIETIPGQKPELYGDYLQAAFNDFKAPSTLTKHQASIDLKLDDKEIKLFSKDEVISEWVEYFKSIKASEIAEQEWRKTSFDGGLGEVISIAARCGKNVFCSYRRLDSAEKLLLISFFDWIRDQCEFKGHVTTPFFIGHNIPFDLKFLFRRAVILGIDPKFELPFNGMHGRHYFCNSQAWSSRGDRISQNNLAAALGIPLKPDDIDGSKVWDFVKSGDVKRVSEYNLYDVNTVVKIYNRLNFNEEILCHEE